MLSPNVTRDCVHVYVLNYLGVQIFLPIRTSVFSPLFLDKMWYAQTLRAVDELVGAHTEVFIVSFVVNADWPVMPWVGERGERGER